MPAKNSSKELPKWQKEKNKFFPKYIEMNIDGLTEGWEFEESRFGEKEVWVKYHLKDIKKYKIGV